MNIIFDLIIYLSEDPYSFTAVGMTAIQQVKYYLCSSLFQIGCNVGGRERKTSSVSAWLKFLPPKCWTFFILYPSPLFISHFDVMFSEETV